MMFKSLLWIHSMLVISLNTKWISGMLVIIVSWGLDKQYSRLVN